MNNKDFTIELAIRLGRSVKDVGDFANTLACGLTQQLQDGNSVSVHSFGTFEVKKKNERISVNPLTKQRSLVPPKLVPVFRPSPTLKDKFK